jgi:hypothetical protein
MTLARKYAREGHDGEAGRHGESWFALQSDKDSDRHGHPDATQDGQEGPAVQGLDQIGSAERGHGHEGNQVTADPRRRTISSENQPAWIRNARFVLEPPAPLNVFYRDATHFRGGEIRFLNSLPI